METIDPHIADEGGGIGGLRRFDAQNRADTGAGMRGGPHQMRALSFAEQRERSVDPERLREPQGPVDDNGGRAAFIGAAQRFAIIAAAIEPRPELADADRTLAQAG
ncbi:hypothetical protein GCM10011614_09550 [Novosphingobium colocasiae]|uniref:Uncharacterized protein n=1 Tax=Novosphingobium colocasiae TaxID=1256513 RepID=A0A918PBF1_9SPHN|nr:hypothetical protein GCM10011614_09550 [Novosphingobium colocasiae]